MSRTVLCVDTEEQISEVSAAVGAEKTLSPIEATSVNEAVETINDDSRSIVGVVTSHELSDGSGMEVIQAVRDQIPQTPVVLFTEVSPAEIDTASFEELLVEYLNRDLPDA